MSLIKSEIEIEKLRKSSLLVGETLAEVSKVLKPGLKTIELDKLAETFIRDNGAIPAFKNYNGFPYTLCISVNDVVVHGMPSNYEIKEGDLVSIDCGTIIDGYYGDSAFTFGILPVDEKDILLMQRTYNSLYKAIDVVKHGIRTGDIGYAVQSYISQFNYGIIREMVGHGIGKKLHDKPEVPNYGFRGKGSKLVEGMTFCIEPMISANDRKIKQDNDGWTIRTIDGGNAAHFEHEIAVMRDKADVLSSFEKIEQVNNKNIYITKKENTNG